MSADFHVGQIVSVDYPGNGIFGRYAKVSEVREFNLKLEAHWADSSLIPPKWACHPIDPMTAAILEAQGKFK